ncbi:hypothetical protein AZE42_10979 [Rhizopogon vesiculosus]|uniref:Uncharacterized protein n=1 Tax=Rhizopogon vesiculosus TaxID=180088 RepID=A0A1J8R8D6_9AGAM|nr:hypothetical protein AZE42_10979 [Rhizopogon vesiculosus]
MPRKTATPQNKLSGTHPRVYTSHTVRAKPYNSSPYSSFLLKELAGMITTFARSPVALSPVTITNVTPIASYSWIEASSITRKTIAVPGLEISRAPAFNKSRGEKSPALPIQEVSIFRTTPYRLVPQASIIEIKTCALHRELNLCLYSQLYLSQTAFLYIAKHHCGNFDPPEKVELGAESTNPMHVILNR